MLLLSTYDSIISFSVCGEDTPERSKTPGLRHLKGHRVTAPKTVAGIKDLCEIHLEPCSIPDDAC